MTIISRRELLRTATAAGAAAMSVDPAIGAGAPAASQASGPVTAIVGSAQARVAYEKLTAREADVLEAIVARLIPSDASGPGAMEARATQYIDRALAGALAGSVDAYRAGLAAIDRHSRESRGRPFVELSPTEQDLVLTDLETGAVTGSESGFAGSASTFFAMVKAHTWQGTFGDPYYGGNANFVGWDLLGYPGIRTMVTAADQQRLEQGELPPSHRSAYDVDSFNKASVRRHPTGPATETGHGD
ncbi:MAG: gluconate 2-dehydrogenase subunit 3 family protein [Vicinamibacterales bacterium]